VFIASQNFSLMRNGEKMEKDNLTIIEFTGRKASSADLSKAMIEDVIKHLKEKGYVVLCEDKTTSDSKFRKIWFKIKNQANKDEALKLLDYHIVFQTSSRAYDLNILSKPKPKKSKVGGGVYAVKL